MIWTPIIFFFRLESQTKQCAMNHSTVKRPFVSSAPSKHCINKFFSAKCEASHVSMSLDRFSGLFTIRISKFSHFKSFCIVPKICCRNLAFSFLFLNWISFYLENSSLLADNTVIEFHGRESNNNDLVSSWNIEIQPWYFISFHIFLSLDFRISSIEWQNLTRIVVNELKIEKREMKYRQKLIKIIFYVVFFQKNDLFIYFHCLRIEAEVIQFQGQFQRHHLSCFT